MSEPKLISPLLDGFRIGQPISDHCGVRCCPAMPADSEDKYIIKILSLPASQVKLDALLLTGAFQDAESAKVYFRELAEGIAEEAAILQRLSLLEGFTAYESWQIEPMEDGETGFDVYLKGAYRNTLERLFRRSSITHLAAVNLGLDLCAALAVCRRSGYLYADLKPENISIDENREYRICDLGFLPLESLEYASLPERYLSSYTPPEVADAYSALNTTMDVYAAGLILYQAYNGGLLPFMDRAPAEPLSAPQYADPEMAQIILKACDPNPEVRWQDPTKMGQALVEYLQSHTVNDTPIVTVAPSILPEIAEEETPETPEEPSTDQLLAEVDEALVATDAVMEAFSQEEPPAEDAPTEEETFAGEETPAEEEIPAEELSEEETSDEEISTEEETPAEEISTEEIPAGEETSAEEIPAEELTAEEVSDEELLSQQAAQLQETLGVGEEVSQILVQAEQIIAHELPEPAVAPEPIHVEIPAPAESAEEPSEESAEIPETDPGVAQETASEEAPQPLACEEEEEVVVPSPKTRKIPKGLVIAILSILLAGAMIFGIYAYYENIYLQTVYSMDLKGQQDRLTVTVTSSAADSSLTVYCMDIYGNTQRQPILNGQAVFKNLNPSTRYKITVEIDGFHKLIGVTSNTYTTGEQTSILDFSAATGTENGSVILNFTVQGADSGEWNVRYQAEGEEEKVQAFTGHMVTLADLTVGKEYTFRLEAANSLYLTGTTAITYRVSNLVFAENLQIQGFQGQDLTVTWSAPEGASVENWVVRCYNDMGYNKSLTVDWPSATFKDLDIAAAYTIEVTAAGMTQGTRAYVSANSITVSQLTLRSPNAGTLNIQWEFEGTAPTDGWLVMYTIDGNDHQYVLPCNATSAQISPVIPGSVYSITVKPANGSTVFGGTATYEVPPAEAFSGYMVTTQNMNFRMCKTPENPQWTLADVPQKDFKTTYQVGEKASFAVTLNHEYNTSPDQILRLFVLRDSQGNLVSFTSNTLRWTNMWYKGFGRIDIPFAFTQPGEFTLELYFNGASVHTQTFTVTEN